MTGEVQEALRVVLADEVDRPGHAAASDVATLGDGDLEAVEDFEPYAFVHAPEVEAERAAVPG